MIARGEIDFASLFAATVVHRLDAGVPITVLAGVHPGCFELFAHEPIRTISDLKGKKVGIDVLGSGKHLYVAIMAAQVGLDPAQGHRMGRGSAATPWPVPHGAVRERKVDAFLGFPPEPQELRARKIGRVILNTTTDKPWSQYFCCMLVRQQGVRPHRYPVATKRVLRAVLKADICAAEPERAAQRWSTRLHAALRLRAPDAERDPYASWREFDPEDSLRFYALRLHEVGMIKSSPNELIAEGTDWRFLNELKRELKA